MPPRMFTHERKGEPAMRSAWSLGLALLSAGPVTLYVDGGVDIQAGATVALADSNPEKFALYVAGSGGVNLTGGSSAFHGVVYAPYSKLYVTSQGDFYGAFVADRTQFDKHAQVHYWNALRGQ